MPLYLAIDAGGTKTSCLLADDTRILARASTGTVKLMRVSEQEATARLRTMLAQVAATAAVSLREVTRTCFGLAGITSPAVQTWARETISASVAGELLLVGDHEIALDAAFHGAPGILVIAGTGSNMVGRNAAGDLFGAGGWGPVLGDEGSGYWIGLEALRAALRAQDLIGLTGTSSCLLREIQTHWQLDSLADLVAFANHRSGPQPPPDFAALAPVVARCAEQGDALAAGVLDRAGEELADQLTLVYQKMTKMILPHSDSPPPFKVAFTGSVLSEIAPVRAAMTARLTLSIPSAHVLESPTDPLEGALYRARQG